MRSRHLDWSVISEGLDIPLKILAQSADHLGAKGSLILETGYTWPACTAGSAQPAFYLAGV